MYEDNDDNPGILVLLIGVITGAIGIAVLMGLWFLLKWVFA